MPNRVLRDWTDSEKVNTLSLGGEVFFTRLFMKADDHGRYYAATEILRTSLFPLKVDTIKSKDIDRFLNECTVADLIRIYFHKGKKYLYIPNFGQRLRNMREKYPHPELSDNCQQVAANPPQVAASGGLETYHKPHTNTR